MALLFTTGVVLLLASFTAAAAELHPLSDEFISLINSQQNSWKAGRNFPEDTTMEHLKSLLGFIRDTSIPEPPAQIYDADLIASLPAEFDPRKKWSNCPSLNEIRDQGKCGSCWAFGPVEAMTDRFCIHSNGTKQFEFSAQDLVSCVKANWNHGCYGGDYYHAWSTWRDVGIVSGGPYNSSQGCMPYLIEPCDPGCGPVKTPKCVRKCIESYKVEYQKDKRHGQNIHTVKGEDHIKAELFQNGPVSAAFLVYEDFFSYKSGVYKHVHGKRPGFHAVKMLGWGEEGGQKYWLMANSWNDGWGDKGYFKILRGSNECEVEKYIITGEPVL